MRTPILTVSLLAAIAFRPAPADACSARYQTPYDLFDAAHLVALVDVVTAPTAQDPAATMTVVETLKGVRTASMKVVPSGGTCSPGLRDGERGVVFVDQSQHVIGVYDGFVRTPAVIDALRAYGAATTDAERAKPLVTVATSKDWTASMQAAYSLAERVELVAALGQTERDAIVERLRRVGEQHALLRLAARLQDPRVKTITRRKSFDDKDMLSQVIAGRFEAVTSVDDLADVIAKASTGVRIRIAALERCERIWGPLARRHQHLLLRRPEAGRVAHPRRGLPGRHAGPLSDLRSGSCAARRQAGRPDRRAATSLPPSSPRRRGSGRPRRRCRAS